MKIYTKGGDQGETGLYGGVRVPKDDLRIRVYGTLDELNSILGMLLSVGGKGMTPEIHKFLMALQGQLFQLGAELATPRGKSNKGKLVEGGEIEALEKSIDQFELSLEPLKTFILPGGGVSASWVHLARTVSRRAERELITLNRAEPVRPLVLQYLNRLSDYFFVLARYLNHLEKIPDVLWTS